jgi:signal transduction histidine kinase
MASLGGLVAGIAHDVNTPLGVGVTAASLLQDRLNQLRKAFEEKNISGSQMETFLNEAQETTRLLMTNLYRASDLIASFKQVAVDQTSEAVRQINLKQYVEEILQSLQPSFKKTSHTVELECPDSLIISCAPGVLAQILTNLMMNSLHHGFEKNSNGRINIQISEVGENIVIAYKDNGKGLAPADLERLFDAFFTTKRGKGGSGLGTHIVYNLVTQALGGTITASSTIGQGLSYEMTFPKRNANV